MRKLKTYEIKYTSKNTAGKVACKTTIVAAMNEDTALKKVKKPIQIL